MRNYLKFLFLLHFIYCAQAATLNQLVVQNNAGTSKIQFQLTPGFHYRTFTLTHPDRVIIDFTQIDKTARVNLNVNGTGLIKQVRKGQPNPHTLRFVFDVAKLPKIQTSATKNSLTVLLSASTGVQPAAIMNVSVPQKRPPLLTKPTLTQSSARGTRDVIIVLDAGHGGHDPGAIGPAHRVEKQVTLAIAQTLKSLIDREPGMRAVLTRSSDRYVGLRERLNIARKYNADVFISIHADAFIHAHSHGASVFALSERGATSEAARWLAEKENYSELGGVNLRQLDDKNGIIRSVLLDLSQTATIAAGLQLGTQVLQNLGKVTSLHNRRVEQARFVVLKSPDTPSILIETGFISNPREAENLSNSRYQLRLARAVVVGLKQYFWAHPPHGTKLEVLSSAPRNWFGKHFA